MSLLYTLKARASDLASCTRALAAVEFALIVPFLVTLLVGTLELSRYMGVLKRIQNAASDIALAVSASDQELSGTTLWKIYNMVPILIPDVTTDVRLSDAPDAWYRLAKMNISFINVTNISPSCGSDCRQEARVAWSYGYERRSCGLVTSRSEAPVPKQYGTSKPSNLVSVELRYGFEPLFMKFLPPREILEVVYVPPRYVDRISLVKLGERDVNIGTICS